MGQGHDKNPETSWNNSEAWVTFVLALVPKIQAIACKYSSDEGLREDAVQNVLLELLYKFPEDTLAYEAYRNGEITEEVWEQKLISYCLNVARNEILSTLTSHTTGNFYVGRTHSQVVKGPNGKKRKLKRHTQARYVSLDQLMEDFGVQLAEDMTITLDLNGIGHGDEDYS